MSRSSQSDVIRRTKRYDAELLTHFNEQVKRFVVWEGAEDE